MSYTQVQIPPALHRSADETLLQCSGCRQRFDAHQRRPLVLQCLHSFCEPCVRSFAGAKHGKKVTCSLCRATTKLNGKLPTNHAILEMLSLPGRLHPVNVVAARGGSPVQPCSGPTGQYPGVTVIPVHRREADVDQLISTNDGDDHRSNGTTSINIGHSRNANNGHVVTTMTTSMTSLPVSARSSSMAVTMTSSTCGPSGHSYAAPQNGLCAAQKMTPSMTPCITPGMTPYMTPGMTPGVTPYMTPGMTPGVTPYMIPGMTHGMTSGMTSGLTQAITSGMTPGMPPYMTPYMTPGMTPDLSSTVTSLTVNSTCNPCMPPATTGGSSNDAIQAPSPVDLCCQCRIHPAMLSVTSATQMNSQKLCSSCHALIQQHTRLDGEWENPTRNHVAMRRSAQNATNGSDVPSTTVIKVSDEHNTGCCSGSGSGSGSGSSSVSSSVSIGNINGGGGSSCCSSSGGGSVNVSSSISVGNNGGGVSGGSGSGGGCSCAANQSPIVIKRLTPSVLPLVASEEGHRGSIHVDGRRTGPPVPKSSEVIDPRPSITGSETTVGERSKETEDQRRSLKPTYVSCSKFDLRSTEVSNEKRLEKITSNSNSYPSEKDTPYPDANYESNEEIYRPLPFNPKFQSSDPGPNPIEPPPPAVEPAYPAAASEKQCLDFQDVGPPGANSVGYPSPAQGPPRYEEIVSQGVISADPLSVHPSTVRCVSTFGKYGELATQPGAFRSPSRINASRGGVLVVTDSANRTVQAFNGAGECLALIRVNGDSANGCSCYDKRKMAVGTNSGVQIYDFNGTLKKTIPIGPVINTVCASRGRGFIAVQPKALSIFRGPDETLIRTLKDRSKPGPVRQPVPFDNIADAAVNSQEDIVVLDAGAAAGLGMILIMSDDGYLKSSIVPGREPCGVLRQPQAVAVDQAHNILISDSANRRVLLFAANGKFQRQLIGPGHGAATAAAAADPKTWPVGLDVSDDGRLFVVAKGDKFAEIRVFAYH